MTNAEKIAKDIDLLVEFFAGYDCYPKNKDCKSCEIKNKTGFCNGCFEEDKLRKWLESEAK